MNAQQDAYLAAMGLTRWVRRQDADPAAATVQTEEISTPPPQVASSPSQSAKAGHPDPSEMLTEPVQIGPGVGACLIVCEQSGDSLATLASDMVRCLREPPVWAWPESNDQGSSLQSASSERLLSDIVILGSGLGHRLFGDSIPDQCGSARVTVLPGLGQMLRNAADRRLCWQQLKAAGLAGTN